MRDSKLVKTNYVESMLIAILYFTYLINDLLNGTIFVISSIVLITTLFLQCRKCLGVQSTFLSMLIITMPISFMNLFGGDYGKLPLSWFNVFFISLFMFFSVKIISNQCRLKWISIISLLLSMVTVIPLLLAKDMVAGIKQFINITIFLGSYVIAENIECRNNNLDRINQTFRKSVFCVAVLIIVQRLCVRFLYTDLGYHMAMGGGRDSYGFVFSDFSFLSLYLYVGLATWIYGSKGGSIISIKNMCGIGVVLFASLLVGARTGMVAFSVAYILTVLQKLIKYKSIKSLLMLIVVCPILVFALNYFVLLIRPEGVLSGTGRWDTYKNGVMLFLENPLLGSGLGFSGYNFAVPHNFIIQFLFQTGVIYTIAIIAFFLFYYIKYVGTESSYNLAFWTIAVGGMFIPDILNSRFICIVVLLSMMEARNKTLTLKKVKKYNYTY